MNRRHLSFNWTEEDRRAYAKWRRGMAAFYGCVALIVFGLFALSQWWRVAPDEARDRQAWSAGLQGGRQVKPASAPQPGIR
jgi:hypothetical protein